MPVTLPPKITREELPAVATVKELADFERLDERTVRRALEAGLIPGGFKHARSWRVCTDVYFAQGCRVSDAPCTKGDDADE